MPTLPLKTGLSTQELTEFQQVPGALIHAYYLMAAMFTADISEVRDFRVTVIRLTTIIAKKAE